MTAPDPTRGPSMDLDEIEARANAATEGPWVADDEFDEEEYVVISESESYAGPGDVMVAERIRQGKDEGRADAEFIAHARTDVPALVARVRELEGDLERSRIVARVASEVLTRERDEARRRRDELRAAVAAGEASDGYHTHRELYDYRMLYNAHAAHGWLTAGHPVVKSHRHSDGDPCFGGGWFIVVATLPTGQVSNHYRDEHWHLFDVPEVDLPPEYDGHTPQIAADRLRDLLDGGRVTGQEGA